MKKALAAIISILILAGIVWLCVSYMNRSEDQVTTTNPQNIISFVDCADAGYPIMESNPRQCRTPDGKIFAEESPIPNPTYINASSGMITIDTPTPGSVAGKQFSILGKARGTWFFEATFPVEIKDKDGKIIATGIGKAESNWMTTDLVGFKADITIPTTYMGAATVTLKKDNPSGLEEHDASVMFPITIEY